jgi:hypothetical protein
MKLKPGIKGCSILTLRHSVVGHVAAKQVRGDLFN